MNGLVATYAKCAILLRNKHDFWTLVLQIKFCVPLIVVFTTNYRELLELLMSYNSIMWTIILLLIEMYYGFVDVEIKLIYLRTTKLSFLLFIFLLYAKNIIQGKLIAWSKAIQTIWAMSFFSNHLIPWLPNKNYGLL